MAKLRQVSSTIAKMEYLYTILMSLAIYQTFIRMYVDPTKCRLPIYRCSGFIILTEKSKHNTTARRGSRSRKLYDDRLGESAEIDGSRQVCGSAVFGGGRFNVCT